MSNSEKLVVKKSLSKNKNKNFKPLDTDFLREHNILTPEKLKIIDWDGHIVKIIGAKGCGKTVVANNKMAIIKEQYTAASIWAFRKYKDQAAEDLGNHYIMNLKVLKHYGYDTRFEYKTHRGTKIYQLKDKKVMHNNSYIRFYSLEDPDATDGGAIANAGYFAMCYKDEPIVKSDILNPDKIPSEEEWKIVEDQIKSNIDRFNEQFATLKGLKREDVPKTHYWYTMNDWGKHPLTVQFEKDYHQDDFVKWITGYTTNELIGNKDLLQKLTYSEDGDIINSKWGQSWITKNTQSYEITNDEGERELLARMSIFANPKKLVDDTKVRNALKNIKKGFLFENWRLLAFYAGLQYNAKVSSDMLVYNIKNFNKTTLVKEIKAGWRPEGLSYGIDLDTSRVNTITPVWKLVRYSRQLNNDYTVEKKVLIDKQIELQAMGSGEFGEMHELSAKQITSIIKKRFLKSLSIKEVDNYLEKTFMIIDDNRKHYIKLLKDNMVVGIIQNYLQAVKNGHYDILERIDMIETSFNNGTLCIDESNVALINDFNSCKRVSINNPKRETAGTTNYLDRIDSSEYGIYPFASVLSRSGKYNKIKGV